MACQLYLENTAKCILYFFLLKKFKGYTDFGENKYTFYHTNIGCCEEHTSCEVCALETKRHSISKILAREIFCRLYLSCLYFNLF